MTKPLGEDVFLKQRRALVMLLRRTPRESSLNIAKATLDFTRRIILSGNFKSTEELIKIIKYQRELMMAAEPYEFIVSNVMLSVLKMVREESEEVRLGGEDLSQYDLLNKLWNAPTSHDKELATKSLRKSTLAAIDELRAEMDTCLENICSHAVDQICSTDVVITHSLSKSSTLRAFFEAARKAHRSFRLFTVDEDSNLAASLSSTDILPAMRHATRVVIPAIALLPDGSCIAPSGTISLCLAAKRHVVPVLVCASFYKITPFFIPNFHLSQPLCSPASIVSFAEAESLSNVHIVNPLFDLIPAQLVSLYICHTSILSPPHIYRLIGDYYHPNDISNICA
uniref:Translation initiation factor eIF2B subunit beta n=1 Tax=Syphacia muris TaxID=451379 RepID=A0A0N5AFX6_9BILA